MTTRYTSHMDPPDPLGVREATAWVMERATDVRIDHQAVDAVVRDWVGAGVQPPGWYEKYHFFDGTHRSANWLLALDAVNFSFWAEDPADRWEVEYQGECLNGYWALAASMKRAVEEGTQLWNAAVLAELSQGDVYRIFRGKGLIPLVTDRLNNLREVGRALLAHYQGQFIHAIDAIQGRADRLALLLAHDFPSFNDVSVYKGRKVPIHKRAQLLVSDLWGAFDGKNWGAFTNMEVLTAFADYKVPQILREFGVLEYGPQLAAAVEARQVIPAGSYQEVEIRAATIQACEILAERLNMPAYQVDWLLWQQAQGMPMGHPYHLTRTIYY